MTKSIILSSLNHQTELIENYYRAIEVFGNNDAELVIDIEGIGKTEEIDEFTITTSNLTNIKFAENNCFLIKTLNLYCERGANLHIDSDKISIQHLNIYGNGKLNLNQCKVQKLSITQELSKDEQMMQSLTKSVAMNCDAEYPLQIQKLITYNSNLLIDLKNAFPNLNEIALYISWFANGVNVENVQLKPGIENYPNEEYASADWSVGNYDRNSAHRISRDKNGYRFGGTIDNQLLSEFINTVNQSGIKVVLCPIVRIDDMQMSWSGDMNGNATNVKDFYYSQYKPFILHYAELLKSKTNCVLSIGSELKGLTSIKSEDNTFPFIDCLIDLAAEVKLVTEGNVSVTYFANYYEYFSVDGCLRPMDKLWADKNINYVGINGHFPLTDIEDSEITVNDIQTGWQANEGIEYYRNYDGSTVEIKQDEPWNQWKNIQYWQSNLHNNWDNVTSTIYPTEWMPNMKPILLKFSCASVDKASNEPCIFTTGPDGLFSRHSNKCPDFAIQSKALRATLENFEDSEQIYVVIGDWNVRGKGWHDLKDIEQKYLYTDYESWPYSHDITNKLCNSELSVYGNVNYDLLEIHGNIDLHLEHIESL